MKRTILLLVALSMPLSAQAEEDKGNFSYEQICKAGIAHNNAHSPKPVKVISSKGKDIQVSYVRPSDGKRFKFWCKIEGNEILWQDEYIGRWAKNLRLFYKVSPDGKKLEISSVIKGYEEEPIKASFTKSSF